MPGCFELIIKLLNFFILQMDIRRARQAVEKKDEQLDASRRILEAQEDELFVSVLATSSFVVRNAKFGALLAMFITKNC